MLLGVDTTVDVQRDLARLHYDLAGHAVPRALDVLLTMTTLEPLHYGSDFPFTPDPVAEAASERIDGFDDLTDALRANPARLFPLLPIGRRSARDRVSNYLTH